MVDRKVAFVKPERNLGRGEAESDSDRLGRVAGAVLRSRSPFLHQASAGCLEKKPGHLSDGLVEGRVFSRFRSGPKKRVGEGALGPLLGFSVLLGASGNGGVFVVVESVIAVFFIFLVVVLRGSETILVNK